MDLGGLFFWFADGHWSTASVQSQHDYGRLAGNYSLASHQIMLTISQFTFMMFYGMGAAIAVRVSNFKGQNDMVNVRRSAYAGYHLILAMAVVLLSIVFLLRNQVGGWFTDSVEVSCHGIFFVPSIPGLSVW